MPSLFAILGFMSFGPWELIIVAFVILILFGNRLPRVMRSMGQGVTEFKKGLEEPGEEEAPPKKVENREA
ncbi:MAG: twin-arginine translocase TatA/TatE family subunit [Pirellulales bacterium]